jgi:transcriptional regulator with XRE-family HTH domain
VISGRRRRVDEIPHDQAAVVGANIRVLRQQHGWNQATVGELMGWTSNSTVCAAEGHRNGRQRGFTTREVERLAAIFGLSRRSSRHAARTAAGTRRQGSPA